MLRPDSLYMYMYDATPPNFCHLSLIWASDKCSYSLSLPTSYSSLSDHVGIL
jgi:hypothetical protein